MDCIWKKKPNAHLIQINEKKLTIYNSLNFIRTYPPRKKTLIQFSFNAGPPSSTLPIIDPTYVSCYLGSLVEYCSAKIKDSNHEQLLAFSFPPAGTTPWTNAALILVHRLRRWTRIKPALDQGVVLLARILSCEYQANWYARQIGFSPAVSAANLQLGGDLPENPDDGPAGTGVTWQGTVTRGIWRCGRDPGVVMVT